MARVWERYWASNYYAHSPEWRHSFLSFDQHLTGDEPFEQLTASTALRASDLKKYTLQVADVLPAPINDEHHHIRFTISKRTPSDRWYRAESHALGGHLLGALNRRLVIQVSHWRLRTFWFVSSRKKNSRVIDLTGTTMRDYELHDLHIGLGFEQMGLVDL